MVPKTKHPAVIAAVEAQRSLGWEAFFRGYLVKEWLQAFHVTHTRDAHQQFDQFQQLIWFDVSQPQWYERNKVAHGPDSHAKRIESEVVVEKLYWYNQHRHELLPAEQQLLARRNLHEILRLKSSTRKAWLSHLEIVTAAWEQRKYQRGENQRTLAESWAMEEVPRPPRRLDIAQAAAEYAEKRVLKREQNQPRIDTIFHRVERPSQQGDEAQAMIEGAGPQGIRQERSQHEEEAQVGAIEERGPQRIRKERPQVRIDEIFRRIEDTRR